MRSPSPSTAIPCCAAARKRSPSSTAELEALSKRMFEIMYEEEGVGLAAPQAGVSVRMTVMDVPFDDGGSYVGVLVNPGDPRASRGTEGAGGLPLHSRAARGRRSSPVAAGARGRPQRPPLRIRVHRLSRPRGAARGRSFERSALRRPPEHGEAAATRQEAQEDRRGAGSGERVSAPAAMAAAGRRAGASDR